MSKNKRNKVVADINITPFTDVVLVLLIIFMITTPMLSQHEIKVNLPNALNDPLIVCFILRTPFFIAIEQ